MMYELTKQGLAMALIDSLNAIYKEHDKGRYYIDSIAVYNNLKSVYKAVEKYVKRISRKNADKDKAYGQLLIELFDYDVFKRTEKGDAEMQIIVEKIQK